MSLIKKGLIASALGLTLGLGACKKDFLDRVPSDQVVIDSVFNNIDGARAAIQGLNRSMYRIPNDGREETFGQKGIDLMLDLMGDDIGLSGTGAGWHVEVARYTPMISGGAPLSYMWTFNYGIINNANRILFHIDEIKDGTEEEKAIIKAQAKTYRAYAYFALVQHYQFPYVRHRNEPGVPIYTEPTREGKARSTVEEVYKLIIDDLKDAEDLFDFAGYDPRSHISDINKSVTQGLLARVYLTKYDFTNAADYARKARQGYNLMTKAQLTGGFNLSNGEWMWGSSLNDEQSTPYKSFLSHMDYDAQGYAALGMQKLINRFIWRSTPETSWGENDIRREWFYASREGSKAALSQKKFRVRTKGSSATDLSYMRASEMYLIEAEAEAILGNEPIARQVLQELIEIRNSDYDVDLAAADQIELIKEIHLQRRIELWGEGLRFLDIKRQLYYGPILNGLGGLVVYTENELGSHRELAGGSSLAFYPNATVAPFISGIVNPLFRSRIPGSEIETNPDRKSTV